MTVDERIAKGVQALELRGRRIPVSQIAEKLGVHRNTVGGLIREALGDVTDAATRREALDEALASLQAIERRIWRDLERTHTHKTRDLNTGETVVVRQETLNPTSRTLPQLLAEARGCVMDRVKILGLAEPETLEVKHEHRTLTERVAAYDEYRAKGRFDVIEGGKDTPDGYTPDEHEGTG